MEKLRYQQIYKFEKDHWWYKGRRQLLIKIINFLSPNKNLKILDVGCGTGYNIIALRKFGQVYGVDIAEEAISFCKKRGLKNTFLIKKDQFPFPDNSFDLITCLDVLEHIYRDDRELQTFHRKLSPGGNLIIFVPAFSTLWGGLDEKSHHFRRYTKDQLKRKLELCGFQIKKIGYFGYIFFLPVLLVRIFQRTFLGQKNIWGIEPQIKSDFVNRLLSFIFSLDVVLSFKFPFPFGTSIFAIATKE